MVKDGRDPAEKLKELYTWMMNNKVESVSRIKRAQPTASVSSVDEQPKPASDKAKKEVSEFQDWVREIQSPAKPVNQHDGTGRFHG